MNRLALSIVAYGLAAASTSGMAQSASEHGDRDQAANALRYGVMGVPPGPAGQTPVESKPYAQWVVGFDADGEPVQWKRIAATDNQPSDAVTFVAHKLRVDAEPPTVRLDFSGEAIERAGQWTLSPRADLTIESDDPSGVVSTTLLVDHQPAANPNQWADQRADGRYTLSLMAKDALGNEGERGELVVVLDGTPPTLTWQRLDAREGVAADIFDGERARLAINVTDAAAGLRELQLGEKRYAESDLADGRIEAKVDASALDYTLTDRVGNVGEGTIALRADREGPTLAAVRNGQPMALDGATLQRSDSLTLRAEDVLAGVARACVEASIWYGKCTELPVDIVGIAPGRYALEFRAADRLGNETYTRLSMEVLP